MSQFLRPNSNITQTNFTNGFAEIDESSASDADFAYGANNTAAVLETGLTDPSGTPASGTCTVRYRIAKTNAGTVDGGGNAVIVTGEVYQGTSQIATDSAQTATGTWTEYSFTFAASSVSDWTDLRFRGTTSASGGSPANRRGGAVSWVEIEVPNAAAAVLTADPGSYTLTGTDANLEHGHRVAADAGSYSLTGTAATLSKGRSLVADAGTYALTGTDASLRHTHRLVAESGSYAVTGTDASLEHARKVAADAGSYTLTGSDATLVASGGNPVLVAESGSYALTGTAAGVLVGRELVAGSGLYALTGTSAALEFHRVIGAAAGSYALAGMDATLIRGGVVENYLEVSDASGERWATTDRSCPVLVMTDCSIP